MTARNVLMVKGDYDRAGGPETLLSSMLQAMDRDRYVPSLAVLRKTADNGADSLARAADSELAWPGLLRARRASKALGALLRTSNADLLHTHDMRSNLAACLLGRSRSVPWIAHVHGWLGKTHRLRFRAYERVDQYLIRWADLVLVGSTATQQEALRSGSRQVEVVPNAVVVPETQPDETAIASMLLTLGIPTDRLIVGVIGRVHAGKGQIVLVRAMQRIIADGANVHLLIVGDGPELPTVRALAAELGLNGRVTFTGYHEDATALFPAMDIVVVPSLKESLPLTALEAMARGRCVIASRVGDLPVVIDDNRSGRLVEPADVEGLAAAIRELIAQPDRRKAMGQVAREAICDRYSSIAMMLKIEAIYDRLLERRDARG